MSLDLIDTDAKIARDIYHAIILHLYSAIKKSVNQIELDVSNNLRRIFTSSPVYNSLISDGKLSAELGIPSTFAIRWLDKIIDAIATNLKVKLLSVKTTGMLEFVPLIVYLPTTVLDVIVNLPESSYLSNGYNVDWMDWLINKGNEIIVADFRIQYGNYTKFVGSRTGQAIMIEGGTWRMPPEFAGTRNDNWVTRAIEDSSSFIEQLITTSITRNIEKHI